MGEAPEGIFKQRDVRKWLLTGLLIRLLVMPFTAHSDLLTVYQRAHLILAGRSIKGLGPRLFNYIHAAFLLLVRPFLPYATIWGDPKLQATLGVDWLGFVNQPSAFRALFLFKLPYLAIEVLVIWLLLKLTEPDRRLQVLVFWILNPIVIFSTYIFWRFDVITVSLLLAALYMAKKGWNNRAVAILGIAVLLRVYPIILILPFALILESRPGSRARLAAIGFSPFLASIFAGWAQGEAGLLKNFAAAQHLS